MSYIFLSWFWKSKLINAHIHFSVFFIITFFTLLLPTHLLQFNYSDLSCQLPIKPIMYLQLEKRSNLSTLFRPVQLYRKRKEEVICQHPFEFSMS